MIPPELISNIIVPAKTSDKGRYALTIMDDYFVKHLPLLHEGQFIGVISEDDILDFNIEERISSYKLDLPKYSIDDTEHIYEVLKLLAENKLTLIPVLNREKKYIGTIRQQDLINYFAKTAAFAEPGAIIILSMNKIDYSLAEITRIIEAEGMAILSSFISTSLDQNKIEVTLKLNKQSADRVIAALERYEYVVKASYFESEFVDDLKDRYENLMSYLNI